MSHSKLIPHVIRQFHLNRIREHVFNTSLLLEKLYALPMVGHYANSDDDDNDNSNGVTIPSSETLPFE